MLLAPGQPPPIPAPHAAGTPPPVRAAAAPARVALPAHISIPSIGVSAPVTRVGLTAAGALQVPPLADRNLAAWYDGGPAPGQPGPAVIVGHVDNWLGPSVFYRLHDLRAGARIEISRRGASQLTFTVTRLWQVSKQSFPTRSVYGPAAGADLRLITCGGAFDTATGHYLANLIVFARLTGRA